MNTSSNRMRLPTGFLGVLVVLLACLAGCADSHKAATLSGKVTYPTLDKPVTGGNITLHPAGSQPLSAAIKPDGTYHIGSVPAGDMKVTVETETLKEKSDGNPYQPPPGMKPPPDAKPIPIDASNIPRYVKVPRKYARPNTTTLTCTVQTTGAQTQDFNLTD